MSKEAEQACAIVCQLCMNATHYATILSKEPLVMQLKCEKCLEEVGSPFRPLHDDTPYIDSSNRN